MQEIIKFHHRGGAAHTFIMRRRVDLADLQRKADILVDIHVRVQAVGLEHHRNVAVLRLQIIDHLAVDLDLAGGNVLKAGDHPHRRCLATSRRAKKHQEFLVGDVEVKGVDSDEVTPSLGQVFQPDTGHITPPYPLTAPAVRPLTICRWKNITSTNSGAVADTTAATAYITLPCS